MTVNDDESDIYEVRARELKQRNISDHPMKRNVGDWDEMERYKAESFCDRMGMDIDDVISALCSDPVLWVAIMVPSVTRQSWYEDVLVTWIRDNVPGVDVVNLPNSGDNSLYLIDGVIVRKGDLTDDPRTKTLDLGINDGLAYIVAKHTDGEGGGQDNQYHDAVSFIDEQKASSTTSLILCLDGDYYQRRCASLNGMTRMEHVHELIHGRGLSHNTFVTDYHGMPDIINGLLR